MWTGRTLRKPLTGLTILVNVLMCTSALAAPCAPPGSFPAAPPGSTVINNTGPSAGFSGQHLDVTNSGTITDLVAIAGINVPDATVNVVNSGGITGTSNAITSNGSATVTNCAGGTIQSINQATIFANNLDVNLFNAGTITSGGVGFIAVRSGGVATVINSATITSGGGVIDGSSVNLNNTGTLTAGGGFGAVNTLGLASVFNSGTVSGGIGAAQGIITNSGTISGAANGLSGGNYTVTNTGKIIGGVVAMDVVALTLDNSGLVSGGLGIRTFGVASVRNGGTITGTAGTAVQFSGGPGNVFTLTITGVVNGNVIGLGTDTFQLGGSGSATFDVSKLGAGQQYQGFTSFDKIEDSTWTLTGTSSFSGATTVMGGALIVNGSLAGSAVTVESGALLAGTGTVATLTVRNGGIFAPGAGTAGTSMTVAGNLAFQSGAVYLVQVNPVSANSANVTGTAKLTGATVQAVFAPGTYLNRSWTILHSAELGGTSFTGVTAVPPNFAASLSYTATDVILNLTGQLGGLAAAGFSANQRNVGAAIDNYFNSGGALPTNFQHLYLLTGNDLANGLTLISGEAATGAQFGAFSLGNMFLNSMLDPFSLGREGSGGDAAQAYAMARKAPPFKAPPAYEARWNSWGAAYGSAGSYSGDPLIGGHNVSSSAGGATAGLDYRASSDTILGFAAGGGATGWQLAQGLGSGRSDAFEAGAYAITRQGPIQLSGAVAFSNHWMSTDRVALFGNRLHAGFAAEEFGARAEASYRVETTFATLMPYAALEGHSFHTPDYREVDLNAGGFALAYSAHDASDVRGELGGRFQRQFATERFGVLTMRGRVAWVHDNVTDPALTASFQALPGASFTVIGAIPSKDWALVSGGPELRLANGVTLAARFEGDFARGSQSYGGTGTVRYAW
jgi:uncharacterized protein with beta-barrel porin domain